VIDRMPMTLDAPGTVCAFDSNYCSRSLSGHGGFDQHHRWPVSLGGPENPDDLLILCPNHHHRQHALIRYLVEYPVTETTVTSHFVSVELETARYAVAQWRAAGSPAIAGWPTPAAR
jgi:hypothetical protein